MNDAAISIAVSLVVIALLVGATRLLWRALKEATRALPEVVESVATTAGKAARIGDKAKQTFRDARGGK